MGHCLRKSPQSYDISPPVDSVNILSLGIFFF